MPANVSLLLITIVAIKMVIFISNNTKSKSMESMVIPLSMIEVKV